MIRIMRASGEKTIFETMLSPVELEIELFCRGMRIDETFTLGDGRPILRTRAGLGSGLELVLPAPRKPIWVNVPVVEAFARDSPFDPGGRRALRCR